MTYYAYARAMDPASGDAVLSGATWAGGSPAAELVERCLRTKKRSYLPDPEFGLDLALVQKAAPNAGATLRGAIVDALARFTRPPARVVVVSITVEVRGSALFFDVAFTDPRVPSRRQFHVTGSL